MILELQQKRRCVRAFLDQQVPEAVVQESMEKDLYSALNSEEHQTEIPGISMMAVALEYGVASNLNLPRGCLPMARR